MKSTTQEYKAIQSIGEDFFRCYNAAGRVVMTANVGDIDETGFSSVSVIWKDKLEILGTKGYKAAVNAIRDAAASPNLRNFD